MKALLICPGVRENVAVLAEAKPLSNLAIFGKTLIEHWLEHLLKLGANQVIVLANDRPGEVNAFLGGGARWGMRIQVVPLDRELNVAEARARYRSGDGGPWLEAPQDIHLMDRLPGLRECPMFASLEHFCASLKKWMPQAASPDRIGVREVRPGIWIGLGSRIGSGAELRAPCWVGANVQIGPETVIGPMAVLEDRVLVERGAEVSRSVIGPDTLVGEATELRNSIAMGSTLANWKLRSCVKVPDPFLLCSLRDRTVFGRLHAIRSLASTLAMLWLIPAGTVAMLKGGQRGRPVYRPLHAPNSHPVGTPIPATEAFRQPAPKVP